MRALAILLALAVAACDGDDAGSDAAGAAVAVPGRAGASKTAASSRAERRAYDGAPPVIPHASFGASCIACHDDQGLAVPDVGFAPPSPHERTAGLSSTSRCEQCHVYRLTDELLVANDFIGLQQDLRAGSRAYEGAPPVLPHPVFMRENCLACHSGPAAREEIRTSHPERANCRQCHVPALVEAVFERP